MWRDRAEVMVIDNHRQYIHTKVHDTETGKSFLFTAVYGSPNPMTRRRLWDDDYRTDLYLRVCPGFLAGISMPFYLTRIDEVVRIGAVEGVDFFRISWIVMGIVLLLDPGFVGLRFTRKRGSLREEIGPGYLQ